MKAMDLLIALNGVKDAYIVGAEDFRQGKQKVQAKRVPLKKAWLIAAVIALMLLLVGCTVAYVLSLKDMAFGEEMQEYYDGSSQKRTLLSLMGVEGTPGYQASKEWYEWRQAYDPDESIYHSEEAFSEDFGDDYYAYNLYSREMKDKVDEICAKYGLELLGKMYVDPDVEAACQALQIQGILRPDAQAEADWGNVRYYANGSFAVEGHMTLTGEDGPKTRIVDYSCDRKDAFSDLYGSVGPVGSYEEWTYTTSDGVDVLMVIEQSPIHDSAFMIVYRGPYVFCFSTTDIEDNQPIKKEELEAYAEVFDFTVEPQRVSEEEIAKTQERREIADQEWAAEYAKKMRNYQEKGYDARVKRQKEYCVNPDQLGFTLMDVDGNGTDDLVIGQNGYLRNLYTTIDDGTQMMVPPRRGILRVNYDGIGVDEGYTSYLYLCQDGCLAWVLDGVEGEQIYLFVRWENGELIWEDLVDYDPVVHPDNPWRQYADEWFSNETPISQARYEEIIASHVRKPVDLFPISEFPLADDSPSGIGTPDPVYTSYDELIQAQTEWNANSWFYCLKDLNGDGQDELILHEGKWKGVFTITQGQVKLLVCGEDVAICDENVISFHRTYLDGNQTHCYYKVENGMAVLTDYLRYDKDKDSENPWFQSDDNSGQDVSMVPISQGTYDAIQAKYTPMELDMKPVSQYPLK